jgi:NADPH2:quinone reductase
MSIMKAVVPEAPGPPEAPQIRHLPIPTPRPGEVLIKVAAFGLNRSELHTRLRLAVGVTFPRVLGIEATGTVAACPGGEFRVGQQVATMMGGRAISSTAATPNTPVCLARQVVPFTSSLDWARLGAAPEMLQTQQAKRSFPCTGSTTWMRSRKRTPRWRQAPLPARLSS